MHMAGGSAGIRFDSVVARRFDRRRHRFAGFGAVALHRRRNHHRRAAGRKREATRIASTPAHSFVPSSYGEYYLCLRVKFMEFTTAHRQNIKSPAAISQSSDHQCFLYRLSKFEFKSETVQNLKEQKRDSKTPESKR
jgi:hypothetical protein